MKGLLPLIVTLLIQAFSAFAMMAVPVLVPVDPGTPRLTTAGIGAYVLFAYLGAMIGSLSTGPMVERWGAIRTSQGALLFSAAGLALAALVPGTLMVAALLVGLGYGPITPASSHVLIQTTPPHRRNLVFSIKQTGVPLGVAMTGFFIPPLAGPAGWVGTLIAVALACLVMAGASQPIQPGLDAQTSTAAHDGSAARGWSVGMLLRQLVEPLAVIFRHKGLRSMAIASFILSGIQISFTSYLVSFLTTSLSVTALAAGLVLGLSQLGGVTGRIVWGYLSDRWFPPLLMLSVLCLVIVVASLASSGLALWRLELPILALAALMVIFGATASGWNGVYLAEVARQAPPGEAAKATSGTLACTFLGVIVGAPLFGLVASSRAGFAGAFVLEAALALGAAVTLYAFSRRAAARRHPQPRQA